MPGMRGKGPGALENMPGVRNNVGPCQLSRLRLSGQGKLETVPGMRGPIELRELRPAFIKFGHDLPQMRFAIC